MPSGSSPWKDTPYSNGGDFLGYFQIRPIPASPDDTPYVIQAQYNHRPDLLAYDLYDTPKLWWVFAQRNIDIIEDPVYDIETGVEILLPNIADIKSEIG